MRRLRRWVSVGVAVSASRTQLGGPHRAAFLLSRTSASRDYGAHAKKKTHHLGRQSFLCRRRRPLSSSSSSPHLEDVAGGSPRALNPSVCDEDDDDADHRRRRAASYDIPERDVDNEAVARAVTRHFDTADRYDARRPVAAHTAAAFRDELLPALGLHGVREASSSSHHGRRPFVLDAGCGEARSTRKLALGADAETLVVGVDRSSARLSRARARHEMQRHEALVLPENAMLIQAEIGDLCRLLARTGLVAEHTYLLYPNPYPKGEHLKRRWHAHPAFPFLLRASKRLTLRASWRTYLDEFLVAMEVAADVCGDTDARRLLSGGGGAHRRRGRRRRHSSSLTTPGPPPLGGVTRVAPLRPETALTHFEAKYAAADVPVYELRFDGCGAASSETAAEEADHDVAVPSS